MLNITELIGFGAGSPRPAVSFTASKSSGSDLTTYTYADTAIGEASTTRLVVVSIGTSTAVERSVTGVTIGGIDAVVVADGAGLDSYKRRSFWAARVPTGTTATIVVTYSGGVTSNSIGVWALYNLESDMPYVDMGLVSNNPSTFSVPVLREDSIVLGKGVTVLAAAGVTWSMAGITEEFDINVENVMFHAGGSAQVTAPEPAREVSLTVSNAGGVEYCIVAVWR